MAGQLSGRPQSSPAITCSALGAPRRRQPALASTSGLRAETRIQPTFWASPMSSENHSGTKEDREAKGSVYACLAREAADWIGIVGRFPPVDESYGDGDQDADAGDVIENVQTSCGWSRSA